jgi:hypothetical protein
MRNLPAFLLLAAAAISVPAQESGKTSAPAHASVVDSHEGVVIGIEPWTQASRYKEKFPKKSPLNGGVVAIHVSFRNENDQGVKVDLQRIRLLVELSEENRQEIAPLSAEDVADTVLLKANGKDPTARRVPLPLPVGQSKPARDANWTNLRDACQNAGVPSSVVAAHSTVEGLMYFDLHGEVELLQTARFYVPGLANMGDNQPLSYFDIDLSHGSSN